MYDVVPEVILARIARQYERAIDRARQRYPHWQADEEFSSGALGGTMEEIVKGRRTVKGQMYTWRTNAWPLRGKAPSLPRASTAPMRSLNSSSGTKTTM
jgi:hypothetical protein